MTARDEPWARSEDGLWDEPWLLDAETGRTPRRLTRAERRNVLGEDFGRNAPPHLNEEDEE